MIMTGGTHVRVLIIRAFEVKFGVHPVTQELLFISEMMGLESERSAGCVIEGIMTLVSTSVIVNI